MNRLLKQRMAAALAAFLAAAATAGAQRAEDWPQWRGPQRDGAAAESAAPKTWPAELKRKWNVRVGEGHSSPVVAGKRVFIFSRQGEQEMLSALDLETGRVLWQNRYDAPYTMNMAARGHGKGPKSTPVVANGHVTTLGISGILSNYAAATGEVRWRKQFKMEFRETSPDFGTSMSPIVDRGLVIAHVGGSNSGALWAFDAETGAARWRWTGDGPGYASPIIVEAGGVRQVITQSQDHIVGVSAADGALLWKIHFTTDYTQNIVTPVAYKDLLIFSGINQATFAVRLEQQNGQWKPVEVWRNTEVPMYMSSPVLRGNLLVGMTHRNRGQLFVLDAATGKTLWKGAGRTGENAALILAGGSVLAQTTEGEIIVAGLTEKGLEETRRYTVAESATWAHPALAGTRLLVKDVSTLTLWSVE